MAQVTELIHDYLRHNKKFPHVYCAGCGHGIVLGSLIRSVHSLGYAKDDVVLVAGIGCSGRMAVYVDFNTVHTSAGQESATDARVTRISFGFTIPVYLAG